MSLKDVGGQGFLAKMNQALGLQEGTQVHVVALADRLKSIDKQQRLQLLALCENVFSDPELRKVDQTRVMAAKIVMSLLPESEEIIREWVSCFEGKSIYEVHFSLFCFLDDLPHIVAARTFAAQVPFLVRDYLMNVSTDAGSAAWMAGDLLGEHWDAEEALPVLLQASVGARYVAGRYASLHGLEHLITRLDNSHAMSRIDETLESMSQRDRSKRIRAFAEAIREILRIRE